MTLVWSPRALKDLLAIMDYIGKDSPERAHSFALKIKSKAKALQRFPAMGRVVPELRDVAPSPREILIGDYRLVYHLHGSCVEIITIFHGMRRFPDSI